MLCLPPCRCPPAFRWPPLQSTGAENAAILAVQMLALSDEGLAQKLSQMKEDMAQKVLEKDAALQLKAAAL